MAQLGRTLLILDIYQESVRIAQNIGQEQLSLSMEQVQLQRLMIKATRLLAQDTAQRQIPLTPLLLRDLFFSADPRQQKSLFSTFVRALEAHDASDPQARLGDGLPFPPARNILRN